jgi:hypothetical protein
MECVPWETNSFLKSHNTSCISLNPDFNYHMHKSPPLVRIWVRLIQSTLVLFIQDIFKFLLPCRRVLRFHSSLVICQTTGPQPLPKRFLHLMRSRASSFKWEYSLLSPRSSSNFLRPLPRLLVTSIRPCIFPSVTSFRSRYSYKNYCLSAARSRQIYNTTTSDFKRNAMSVCM